MAAGKSSISSFFSKSSSGAQPKKEESRKPVKKEESSNMFDDQSSMEVDESPTVEKVESQEKDNPGSSKTNKKRSIIDVDGKDKPRIERGIDLTLLTKISHLS